MTKRHKRRSNNFKFIIWLVCIAFILTCAAVVTGGYAKSGYNLEVGKPSPVKLVATRDVENRVATERLRDDARKSVMDIYTVDVFVSDTLVKQMESFFQQAFDLRKESIPIFTPYSFDQAEPQPTTAPKISAYLSQSQIDELLNMDTLTFNSLQDDLTVLLTDLLERGVRPDGEEKSLADARDQINRLDYSPSVKSLAYDIVVKFIEPNLVHDEEETKWRKEKEAAEVAPVIHLRNQKIVDENEIITEEMYEILVALGFVSKSYAENILPSVGAIIIIAIVFIFSMMYINYFNKEIKERRKSILLIFTLYVSIILLTWLMISVSYFFIPVLVFTMLVSMLISYRLSIFLNFSITIITLLIYKGDIDYLIYYSITGMAVSILASYTTERNKVILVGLLTGIVNVCVLAGYTIFFQSSFITASSMRGLATDSVFAILSGLLSVIIATGSLPIWEAGFGIITPLKLLDLTKPDNELLSRLTIEAPGTYHHSLIVANLAETAAYDIGANPSIARVGGYYHDIGKLKYPQYFSENMVGDNPHNSMDAYSSVQVIRSHVDFGLEMAASYKLPMVIKEMIAQHHGTTLIKYFYIKTKNENPDGEINEADFRYNQQRPTSREAAVVMLADTVEAAVRSMIPTGKPVSEVEGFVRSLIKDKLDDKQLDDSGLTIKDLDTTAKSFMRVFKGMYHERIPYPKEKKPAKDKVAESKA